MPETEVDARVLPKPEKHPTIFATFAKLAVGESFVLVNDHEPEPLRKEFEAEQPDSFGWEYLERGPIWRTRISKLTSTPLPRLMTNTATDNGSEPDPAGVVWKLEVQSRELDAEVTVLAPNEGTNMHVGPEVDAVVHVLSGSGQLITEQGTTELAPGALLWMPRRSRRQFLAAADGLRYLTVHQRRQFLGLTPAARQAG